MNRYIALLRGINVSGKNTVPMAELKKGAEALGFNEVKTYLNSGNVIFSADENDTRDFAKLIEAMIKERFGFDTPVFVITQEKLADILRHAPGWWSGDSREIYDNLILIIRPATFAEVSDEIGEPKAEYERIENYQQAVFWSFNRKEYQKTNWWSGTANTGIRNKITIRTANTIRRIVAM